MICKINQLTPINIDIWDKKNNSFNLLITLFEQEKSLR